jgi:DNA-directed RNA polymerase specialized sigma24 family protein
MLDDPLEGGRIDKALADVVLGEERDAGHAAQPLLAESDAERAANGVAELVKPPNFGPAKRRSDRLHCPGLSSRRTQPEGAHDGRSGSAGAGFGAAGERSAVAATAHGSNRHARFLGMSRMLRFSTFIDNREDILASLWEPVMRAVKLGQPTGTSDLEIAAYFRTAVRNRALNFLRARRQRPDAPGGRGRAADHETDDPLDALQCPEPDPEQRAMLEAAIGCINGWSAQDRFLFLEKLQGVPATEIKKALEAAPFRTFLAAATIDTRFHRLQSRLRATLDREP